MRISYTAREGVRYTGDEDGSFLADSINNDSQLIINDGWTIVQGTGQVIVEKDIITLYKTVTTADLGVVKAITTEVGQPYSVSAHVLDSALGLSTFEFLAVDNQNTSVIDAWNSPIELVRFYNLGLHTLTFIAQSTTTYVWIGNVSTPLQGVIVKNEVEVRKAKLVGSEEGIELNNLSNATSDQVAEADSTNGYERIS